MTARRADWRRVTLHSTSCRRSGTAALPPASWAHEDPVRFQRTRRLTRRVLWRTSRARSPASVHRHKAPSPSGPDSTPLRAAAAPAGITPARITPARITPSPTRAPGRRTRNAEADAGGYRRSAPSPAATAPTTTAPGDSTTTPTNAGAAKANAGATKTAAESAMEAAAAEARRGCCRCQGDQGSRKGCNRNFPEHETLLTQTFVPDSPNVAASAWFLAPGPAANEGAETATPWRSHLRGDGNRV